MKYKLTHSMLIFMLVVQVITSGLLIAPAHGHAVGKETVEDFLSDWNWTYAEVGWSNPKKDQGLNNLPLKLRTKDGGTKVYEKGVFAHADSTLTYDIEGKGVLKFQSDIGINYSMEKGSSEFIVSVDDEVLFKSDVIREKDPLQSIDIEIPADAKTLKLETTTGGDGSIDDHSIWANAKVISDASMQEDLYQIRLSSTKDLLTVNEQAEIDTEGILVNGNNIKLTNESASIKFSSADNKIAEINDRGIVTAKKSGTVEITAEVVYEGITKTSTLPIYIEDGDTDSSWIVKSPDESVKTIFILKDGQVKFTSFKDGKVVIRESPTGLVTGLGDFTKGLTFKSKTDQYIDDSYELIGAKQSFVETEANEMTLNFEKNNITFQIIARSYNDGFAFRYGVMSEDGELLTISSEETGFKLPEYSVSQAMSYDSTHQQVAYEKQNHDLINESYIMPLLFQTPNGTWGLISEAALSTEYSGAMLKGDSKGNGLLNVLFSPEQKEDISTKSPFVSPWRFVVMGSTADIVENTMAENLSPPSAIEDTSWINPGVSAWTWLNRESTSDFDTYKRYVDLAADMGWEYVLLDEGWQPRASSGSEFAYEGYYDWIYTLIDYANEKDVGLLVWANYIDLDTPEKQEIIEEWEEMGFKGIKPDFFNSQSQDTMILYDQLMRKTAEHHMLLNPHGSNKTTGQRRTWPNTLTSEGVFGGEMDLFTPELVSASHNAMLPFTRNAVGPADYTPMLSFRNKGDRTPFSLSHMAALTIIYESGIQVLADRDNIYRETPANYLLKNLPASWDESHLVDGYPGEYVNIARRSGDDWYVGIITDAQKDAKVSLDFLDDETYYAFIYKDGKTVHDIEVEMKEVTKNDTLTIPLLETGGASIKIMKELPSQAETITIDNDGVFLQENETTTLETTLSPNNVEMDQIAWTSSDEDVATVQGGKITALKSGTTTVTATTGINNDIKATVDVIVTIPTHSLADNWDVLRSDVDKYRINTLNSLTITTSVGEYASKSKTAKNVFLTEANSDNFTISTKLDFKPEINHQTAGLLIYLDEDNMFGVFKRSHSNFYDGKILATFGLDNNKFSEQAIQDPDPDQSIYLKLTKEGSKFTAYYSYDNEKWTQLGEVQTNNILGAAKENQLKAGLYAVNGDYGSGEIDATFEDFSIEETVIPFADFNTKVVTEEATDISSNSATLHGSVHLKDGDQILERGFRWKEINDNAFKVTKVTDDDFVGKVTDLTENKKYVYRAYAITENGDLIFGEETMFTTQAYEPIKISDIMEALSLYQEELTPETYRELELHLTAVAQFEKKEVAAKVIKHMENFNKLLDYQLEKDLIPKELHEDLKTNSNLLIQEWNDA